MSEKKAKKAQSVEVRRRFILENIGLMDILIISKEMGVHERTIYRDIEYLKSSGEWEKWIENELLRLHRKTTISDVTKYKELAKLRAKSMVQKTQVKADVDLVTETKQVIDWSKLDEEERSKLIDAGRILIRKRSSERKPSSLH